MKRLVLVMLLAGCNGGGVLRDVTEDPSWDWAGVFTFEGTRAERCPPGGVNNAGIRVGGGEMMIVPLAPGGRFSISRGLEPCPLNWIWEGDEVQVGDEAAELEAQLCALEEAPDGGVPTRVRKYDGTGSIRVTELRDSFMNSDVPTVMALAATYSYSATDPDWRDLFTQEHCPREIVGVVNITARRKVE